MTRYETLSVAGVVAMFGALVAAVAMHGDSTVAASAAPHDTPARRVVSLNLCVDQLLLAVADRDQIAGLTRFARDPGMSANVEGAREVPILGSSADALLAARPDLVIGMPATGNAVLRPLDRQGYRTLDLAGANSFAEIARDMRAVAAAVGHPQRAETLLQEMDARLARIGRPGHGRVAAYYQRRGYLTGQGTLVDELMQRLGLANLAQRLDKPPLAAVSLEEMVDARPDFIVMEAASAQISDQGTEMLHHPALRDVPRLYVPEAWTVCGGPAYVQAAESLASQIRAAAGR